MFLSATHDDYKAGERKVVEFTLQADHDQHQNTNVDTIYDNNNFKFFPNGTLTATITQKPAVFAGATFEDKAYDGTVTATVVSPGNATTELVTRRDASGQDIIDQVAVKIADAKFDGKNAVKQDVAFIATLDGADTPTT